MKALKNTNGTIRFNLKDSFKSLMETPTKESIIMLQFSSGKKRFKKSLGFKCTINQWDMAKQRVKTTKGLKSNAFKVNSFLNQIQTFTEEKMADMINSKGHIDTEELFSLITKEINGVEEEIKNDNLIDFVVKTAEERKKQIKKGTYYSYQQTINVIQLYEKKYHKKLTFESIDLSFYRSFTNFLEKEGFKTNTIGKHIKNLKSFLNEGYIQGVNKNIIFKNRNFRVLKESTTSISLSVEEIELLAKADFSNKPKVGLARDIFLIGCYTGQRVSDYNGLTKDNIIEIDGHKFINIRQKKTNTIVQIPITENIKKIMIKYDDNFPPKISEPVLRKNIKEACRIIGLREKITIISTIGGKEIKEDVPKYKLVKTHTARRSFCTNHYKAKKSIQDIMFFSGHKTEKNFYNYIKIEKEQKALNLLKSGFFK